MTIWNDTNLGLIRGIMINMDKQALKDFLDVLNSPQACSKESEIDTANQYLYLLDTMIPGLFMSDERVDTLLRDWVATMQPQTHKEVIAIVQSSLNELEGMVRDAVVEKVIEWAKDIPEEYGAPKLEDLDNSTIKSLSVGIENPNTTPELPSDSETA